MASTVKEGQSFKVAKGFGLNAKTYLELPEAATQTFKKGSPIIVSSGFAQESADDSEVIYGIAAAPGSNGTNAGDEKSKVIPALPGYVFEGVLGSSSGTAHVLANTDLGSVFGLSKDATNGGWYLDDQETAVAIVRCRVIGFKDAVGTSEGRVYFVFLVFSNDTDTAADSATPCTLLGYSAAA